nr:YlbF family regulator [Fictibacillus solisalsi]
MMSNLYDLAYDLENALRNSEDFQTLKKSYAEVNADPEAKKMFDEFRTIQMGLQQKQMSGEQITQEEVEKAQALFQSVQQNEVISTLMNTEQRMSVTISDLNKIITKPLEELYGPMVDENQQ